VINKINGMNQWTQENVKFKTTINQWHPDTATQSQQSLGRVACRIAVVEIFSCNNNNQPAAEATINAMLLAATYSSKARIFLSNN